MTRLFKFLTVGASGAVISLTTLWLLTDLAGWHYLLSYLVAGVLSVSNNYFWNSRWTFNDRKASKVGYGKYALISAGTLGLRELAMFLLVDIAGLWYMLSAIVLIALASIINFVLSRRFVWNKPRIDYYCQ